MTDHLSITRKAAAAMFIPTDAERPLVGQKHDLYPVTFKSQGNDKSSTQSH